jgi:hypothetical protein
LSEGPFLGPRAISHKYESIFRDLIKNKSFSLLFIRKNDVKKNDEIISKANLKNKEAYKYMDKK